MSQIKTTVARLRSLEYIQLILPLSKSFCSACLVAYRNEPSKQLSYKINCASQCIPMYNSWVAHYWEVFRLDCVITLVTVTLMLHDSDLMRPSLCGCVAINTQSSFDTGWLSLLTDTSDIIICDDKQFTVLNLQLWRIFPRDLCGERREDIGCEVTEMPGWMNVHITDNSYMFSCECCYSSGHQVKILEGSTTVPPTVNNWRLV